jgi:hypothetical protein
MADPIVGQKDSPHVRVPDESYAQHVVDLTFQPIGCFPHALHRRHGGLAAIGLDLEHELVPVLQRKQVIHDLDQVARRPVDAGDVLAIVKIQPRLGLGKLTNFNYPVGLHSYERIDLGVSQLAHGVAELGLELGVDLLRVHATWPRSAAGASRATSAHS